jgi:hypothetical protein
MKRLFRFFLWMTVCSGGMAQAADWSFVMLGDTRGNRTTTNTGIAGELGAIATKIASLSLRPEFVMVAGDLCNGNDLPAETALTLSYTDQFNNWKAAMNPVFNYTANTGIPIYTVRGNHENNDSEGPVIPELKQAYYDPILFALGKQHLDHRRVHHCDHGSRTLIALFPGIRAGRVPCRRS